MKSVGLLFALGTALSIGGCLEAQKITPPTPSGEEQTSSNSVTLSLPRTALAELGSYAERLVIRAFKVDQGSLGTELRDAYQFSVTEAGIYSLDGLPQGEVEFQVALLDERNQPLAEGNLRTTISPGSQTLPQLVLKPLKPAMVDLNLNLALQLVNFPSVPVTVPAEPEALRNILKTYKCQSCHNNGPRPTAGLDLQSFPYKNASGATLAQILTRIEQSLTGREGVTKMPPNNAVVKEDEAAVVRNFLAVVIDASNASNQQWVQDIRLSLDGKESGRFETSLTLKNGVYELNDRINLTAGSRYAYTLTVFGPGGSKLYEMIDGALDVPLDGRVQLKVDVVYQGPNVGG
jgi:cytochrome c551/c552